MDSRQLSFSLEYDAMSLTLQQLDRHLFKCADIILNTVDETDYKDFIFPLVFPEGHAFDPPSGAAGDRPGA
jgi:type I restriction enzyme M protein